MNKLMITIHKIRVLSKGHWTSVVSILCVCVCIPILFKDLHMTTHRHTEDSKPSEDLYTGPQKTLAKNAEKRHVLPS